MHAHAHLILAEPTPITGTDPAVLAAFVVFFGAILLFAWPMRRLANALRYPRPPKKAHKVWAGIARFLELVSIATGMSALTAIPLVGSLVTLIHKTESQFEGISIPGQFSATAGFLFILAIIAYVFIYQWKPKVYMAIGFGVVVILAIVFVPQVPQLLSWWSSHPVNWVLRGLSYLGTRQIS